MKKIGLVILFTALATACSTLHAQNYKMALGVRFSSNDAAVNNSVSFKYFFNQKTAIEGLLSFGDPLALGVLLEKHQPFLSEKFTWFYGGGAYLGFKGPRNVGAQGVLGLDYKLPVIPVNLSIDWKPELNLAKEFSFEPAAIGVSARFTFK
jgi:hypothetical protein